MRMGMSSLESIWRDLSSEHERTRPTSASYSLQLVESTPAVRVFAAWGGTFAGPGLLVDLPLKLRKAIRSHLSSRAFSMQVAEFPGLPPDRIGVMAALSDNAYQDLFLLLCGELKSAVSSAPTDQTAASALQRVVDRWRHFVERRSAPLSPERIRGLIGEVVILMRLMAHIGPRNALTQWTGPHDALRDFELDDASVEVKTYQAPLGSSVRISGPEQLEIATGRPVYLAVVEIAASVSSGRTLPEILAVLADAAATQPGGAELLEEKLAQYGYLGVHAGLYTDAYVVGRARLYAVRDGFPRLPTSVIPPGVDDVTFSVRLAAINQFEVDPISHIGPMTALETLAA
jgi:hypothetical protein